MWCTTQAGIGDTGFGQERIERHEKPAGLPVFIQAKRVEHGPQAIENEVGGLTRPQEISPLGPRQRRQNVKAARMAAERQHADAIVVSNPLCT